MLLPVTSGGAAGVFWPAGMNTVSGDMLTTDGSLLVRLIVTPGAGAAAPKDSGKGSVWSNFTDTAGSVIVPAENTLTLTTDSAISGRELMRTSEAPTPTPVIGTIAEVPPAGMAAVTGTPTTPGLSATTRSVRGTGVGDA